MALASVRRLHPRPPPEVEDKIDIEGQGVQTWFAVWAMSSHSSNRQFMNDSVDIRGLLESWPYDADENVRLVRGEDGREVLQVRLPLGLEQYEMEGRPDGLRPHGKESLLEFHLERLAHAKATGQEQAFSLEEKTCAELFAEGTIYYCRYLRLFQIKDWPRTVRDTARNLRLFDFVNRYAEREEDRMYLEQWRPYILRIHAIAAAMIEIERGRYDDALQAVNSAIGTIEALTELEEETFKFERQRSLVALREIAAQIEKNRPLSELEVLERRLRRAIEKQEFERAAQLRDRIRALRNAGGRA